MYKLIKQWLICLKKTKYAILFLFFCLFRAVEFILISVKHRTKLYSRKICLYIFMKKKNENGKNNSFNF